MIGYKRMSGGPGSENSIYDDDFLTPEQLQQKYSKEAEIAKTQIAQKAMAADPQNDPSMTAGITMPSQSPSYSAMPKSEGVSETLLKKAPETAAFWAAGGPGIAAMTVGGSILAQSMANAAQAEQAKRQREMEIAQQQSQGNQRGIESMLGSWGRAFR